MFEVFDIPSQMNGSIGPVMQGMNFDWMRQDIKPGLINPNLIIDEEVFFSVFGSQSNFVQQLMNFYQLPAPSWTGGSWGYPGTASQLPLAAGSSPVPIVVTSTLATGAAGSAYPMNNVGMAAPDPLSHRQSDQQPMKVAFAQFLALRHGGSGYVFGYGSGLPGQNFSIYPPTTPTPTRQSRPPPFRPTGRSIRCRIPTSITRCSGPPRCRPRNSPIRCRTLAPTAGQLYAGDPGVKNPLAYPGYKTGPLGLTNPGPTSIATTPTWVPGPTTLVLPPAIPLRRLFQIPDAYPGTTGTDLSNASEIWRYIAQQPETDATGGNPATGALPPFNTASGSIHANNDVASIFWPGTNTPTGYTNPYLGAVSQPRPFPLSPTPTTASIPTSAASMLQKAVNLTTSRTHQYAVWITVGFFEVRRQGDLLMAAAGAGTQAATLAYDILGPEVGASTGATTRYRSFFIVDRLKLTAYDPNVIGSFRPAVVSARRLNKEENINEWQGRETLPHQVRGGVHPFPETRQDGRAIARLRLSCASAATTNRRFHVLSKALKP